MDRLDLSAFGDADDLVVAIIPNEEGVWLTIIQETAEPLDEVAILPGFHRAYPWPADPPEVLH